MRVKRAGSAMLTWPHPLLRCVTLKQIMGPTVSRVECQRSSKRQVDHPVRLGRRAHWGGGRSRPARTGVATTLPLTPMLLGARPTAPPSFSTATASPAMFLFSPQRSRRGRCPTRILDLPSCSSTVTGIMCFPLKADMVNSCFLRLVGQNCDFPRAAQAHNRLQTGHAGILKLTRDGR